MKNHIYKYNKNIIYLLKNIMKLEKNKLPKSKIELIIEEEAKNIARERKHVIDHLKETAEIKWYRKWQVPEEILVKKYGEEYINQMVIDHAIDHLYQDAVRQEKLIPVSQAEIVEIVSQEPLKFKVHVEIFPEVKIKDGYKKIKLKKNKIDVSDKEVEAALTDIQTRFTKFEEAKDDYKAKSGDKVIIDTDWYDSKWTLLENTSMKDYPLVIWSKIMVPWFEDGLVWKKKDEEIDLPITFPKDYHNKDFAWKETNFKVKIKNIEKSLKPEFTPEFIKDLRWKDLDLEWFKALIKEEIRETKEMNSRIEDEKKLIDELLKVCELDIWDNLMKNQIEKVYDEIKENISRDGLRIADYLESLKLDENSYKDKHVKPVAEKRLQWELILHALQQKENVEVGDDEMKKEVEIIMARFSSPEVVEKLKDLYVPWNKYFEELRQRVAYRKLIDSFFE